MSSDSAARCLGDMLRNIERVRRHTKGMTAKQFLADDKTQDAVERCLQRISEAARRMGDALDATHPELELAKLRQFGSVLRHDYGSVDADLIWTAVTRRLPLLEAACRRELGVPD
jgi:uncharacterized protein with HEPN domain